MDLSIFFEAVPPELTEGIKGNQLGSRTWAGNNPFPDWKQADLVMFGVADESSKKNIAQAVRPFLYPLSLPNENLALADLGDLKLKDNQEASFDALAYVLEQLMAAGKTVIMLADRPHVAFAQYLAFSSSQKWINYSHIGGAFQIGELGVAKENTNFNHHIFVHEPNCLFAYTNLGYQSYYVSQEELKTLEKLHFSACRYGELSADIQQAEPFLRESQMLNFEMSAIRQSECPAAFSASPGGFSGQEACQLARYAGISPQLQSCCFSGLSLERDVYGQSAHLLATMIWYFMEGYYHRPAPLEPAQIQQFRRYSVQLRAAVEQINFYYDAAKQHWWMEVPLPNEIGKVRPQHRLVACSEADYQTARHDEIPERWWKVFHRLEEMVDL